MPNVGCANGCPGMDCCGWAIDSGNTPAACIVCCGMAEAMVSGADC